MEDRKMKKILALMLVLVLALGLVACGGGETAETPEDAIKVGYSCNNFNDTFQTYIVDAAKAAAADAGITLDVQDAQEDVIKQQDQVKAMIEQGVAALIVVPVDTSAMGPITDAAQAAGIPLVYVNRNPFGEGEIPENVYYVGSQEIDAGKFQAEYLKEMLPDGGGVGILQGILSNEGALKRTEGNEVTLAGTNFTVLAKESGNWQRDQGLTLTENWLTAYGDKLNAILANNDEMALGAVQALQAAGRTDVIVMGVDAIPDAKNAVAGGTLAATVLQDAEGQGGGAVGVVSSVLAGEAVEPITWVPFVLITPENIADFQ